MRTLCPASTNARAKTGKAEASMPSSLVINTFKA
jgi:hypothetical protein